MRANTNPAWRGGARQDLVDCGSNAVENSQPLRATQATAPVLRPYQVDVIAKVDRAVEAGQSKTILVAP
jgi:hypothetical protein